MTEVHPGQPASMTEWFPHVEPERPKDIPAHMVLVLKPSGVVDWYWWPEGDGIRWMFRTEELRRQYVDFDIWDLPIGRGHHRPGT